MRDPHPDFIQHPLIVDRLDTAFVQDDDGWYGVGIRIMTEQGPFVFVLSGGHAAEAAASLMIERLTVTGKGHGDPR